MLGLLNLASDGVGEPGCDLWVLPDAAGRIVAVTGCEYGRGGHVLLRSVAVAPPLRGQGIGRALAEHTLAHASAHGCTDAWLFSRTNGAFWQHLGFRLRPTADLVAAVPHAHQVVAFAASGHLEREIAWHLPLTSVPPPGEPATNRTDPAPPAL